MRRLRARTYGRTFERFMRRMISPPPTAAGRARDRRNYDRVDHIDCPVCKTQLIRMVDRSQPHIHYEACTTCYGVYFDAGEFRDYKERTVLDFFRDLFTKERP